jgi:hypothetical protein
MTLIIGTASILAALLCMALVCGGNRYGDIE